MPMGSGMCSSVPSIPFSSRCSAAFKWRTPCPAGCLSWSTARAGPSRRWPTPTPRASRCLESASTQRRFWPPWTTSTASASLSGTSSRTTWCCPRRTTRSSRISGWPSWMWGTWGRGLSAGPTGTPPPRSTAGPRTTQRWISTPWGSPSTSCSPAATASSTRGSPSQRPPGSTPPCARSCPPPCGATTWRPGCAWGCGRRRRTRRRGGRRMSCSGRSFWCR
mmetsp:Transcript_25286/g.64851  ORF Transcript_25286/g.64851 Transcript_25286/m.64851 type:complete len:221 (+) Transcript_25286:2168-2830(+)